MKLAESAPKLKPEVGVHWRGHVFLFARKRAATFNGSVGVRLLLIFLLLEGVIGPRLSLFRFLNVPLPPLWLRISTLLAFALLLVRFAAGVNFSEVGLYRWREWSGTEKSYFVQLLIISNAIFLLIFWDRLRTIVSEPTVMRLMLTVMLPDLVWGFYQELVYRGILQTELVRRFGSVAGVLVANILFTFGPLHFYHFQRTASPMPVFAGIFAIGLFFGTVFQKSGNLWIVAIAHGIGNFYIEGTGR